MWGILPRKILARRVSLGMLVTEEPKVFPAWQAEMVYQVLQDWRDRQDLRETGGRMDFRASGA
jgi:hypothetical protein